MSSIYGSATGANVIYGKNNTGVAFGGGNGGGFDDTGLKAYWKFNQSSGSVTNDSTSDDSLSSGADLTIHSTPEYSVSSGLSGFGNCMYFNESAGTGDSATAGTSLSQFAFLHNATDITWTLNFWFLFPASTIGNNTFIDQTGAETGSGKYGIFIINSAADDPALPQTYRLVGARGVGNTEFIVTGDGMSENFIPTDNAFHMYTFTYDQSLGSDNLKCYRDAANQETFDKNAAEPPATNDSTYALQLFSYANQNSVRNPEVKVLEWSIWNRVLTSDEVDTLYNSGNGTPIY